MSEHISLCTLYSARELCGAEKWVPWNMRKSLSNSALHVSCPHPALQALLSHMAAGNSMKLFNYFSAFIARAC